VEIDSTYKPNRYKGTIPLLYVGTINEMTYSNSFLTTMHNVEIHFERRSTSLAKVGNMKWWRIGHTFTLVFNNNYINYDAAISSLNNIIYFNHAMEI